MANTILGKTHVYGRLHNRVILEYTVATNNETTYTLSITVKYRYYREKGEISELTSLPVVKVTGTGHDYKDSGSKVPNYKTTTQETTYISTFSWSWTKGHTPQTITVTAYNQDFGSAYAASVTLTVPERKYYNVSYNTNSGTGTIAGQKKYHGQALTLTTSKPSKSGYTFKGWATSEANAKAGTITYPTGVSNTYTGNASLTLWAVWEVIYQKPTIKITSIERCNQDGSANDEGEWTKVIFDWSVFKTSPKYYNGSDTGYSANVGKTVVITVGSISETVTLSGQSGSNVSQIIGASETKPFNKDTTYTLNAKITDNYSDYTVSGKLGTAEFPLDFNGDATALGIFRSAPDNAEGIYFGKTPKLVNGIPNTNTYYGATREDNANSSIHFGIGSGGVNRGIWIDNNDGRSEAADDGGSWLIYAGDGDSDRTDVYIPGKLHLRSNDSSYRASGYLGQVIEKTLTTAKPTAVGTWYTVCYVDLPPGKWLLLYTAAWTAGGSGHTAGGSYTCGITADESTNTWQHYVYGGVGNYSYKIWGEAIAQPSTYPTVRYYLRAAHTGGGMALTMPAGAVGSANYIRAICIG